MVHLDELTGQHSRDIFNPAHLEDLKEQPIQPEVLETEFELNTMTPEQLEFQDIQNGEEGYGVSDLEMRLSKELQELYAEYHDLAAEGKKDYSLESRIVDIEAQLRELA